VPTKDEQATDLFRWLSEHAALDSAIRGEEQGWFRLVWTRVLVALGDEPIKYLDGKLDGEWGAFTIDLMVYTPSRLVRVTGTGTDENPQVRVWTYSRRLLQQLDIDGGAPYAGSVAPSWPGRVVCTATYPDEKLRLPERLTDTSQRAHFLEFLPSLLADLEP